MKRYSDGAAGGSGANGNGGYSPGRSWKRIRPPADDDSDSSVSSIDSVPIDRIRQRESFREFFSLRSLLTRTDETGHNVDDTTSSDSSSSSDSSDDLPASSIPCRCVAPSNGESAAGTSRSSMILLEHNRHHQPQQQPTTQASTSSSSSSSSSVTAPSSRRSLEETANGVNGRDEEVSVIGLRASTNLRASLPQRTSEESLLSLIQSLRQRYPPHSTRPTPTPTTVTPRNYVNHNINDTTNRNGSSSSSSFISSRNVVNKTLPSVSTLSTTLAQPCQLPLSGPPLSSSASSGISQVEDVHALLVGLLECPVCLEPIVPPIHECCRGHLVCGKCKVQLSRCPTCRDKLSAERNYALERFCEHFRYPCRNTSSGCPIAFCPVPGPSGRAAHEAACSFRRHNCLFRTCPWSGLAGPEQFNHLRTFHSSRFLEGDGEHVIEIQLDSPTLFHTDWAVSCLGGRLFRLNVFQHIPNSVLYASVHLVSGSGQHQQFTYTVSVIGRENRRLSYCRQTHDADKTRTSQLYSSAAGSEDCFCMKSDKTAQRRYATDDGRLRLHIRIEQLASGGSASGGAVGEESAAVKSSSPSTAATANITDTSSIV